MIKRGFSLVEVMIALMIAALVITGLFTTLYQLGDTQVSLDKIISAQERAAIIVHQMERDLMGAFIPEQVAKVQTKAQEKKEEETAIIDKIFYATDQDGQLNLLTFITNNPLEIYLNIKNAKPKPRVARVVYRLVPEKGHKDSYTLMRQEDTNLDFKQYKENAKNSVRPYAMVEGIAALRMNYLKIDTQNQDKQTKQRVYKKEKNWGTEKKEKAPKITLPEYVELILELWNADYKTKTDFTLQIPILIEPMDQKKPTPQPAQSFFPRSTPQKVAQVPRSKKVINKPGTISITTLLEGVS